MNLDVDRDVQATLEFMKSNVDATRLVGVAERLPEMARLLWGHFQQEPITALHLSEAPMSINSSCATPPIST
jgi:hypothetical protein